jgi:hypothetical protein
MAFPSRALEAKVLAYCLQAQAMLLVCDWLHDWQLKHLQEIDLRSLAVPQHAGWVQSFPNHQLSAYKDFPAGVDLCILRDTNINVNLELNRKDE